MNAVAVLAARRGTAPPTLVAALIKTLGRGAWADRRVAALALGRLGAASDTAALVRAAERPVELRPRGGRDGARAASAAPRSSSPARAVPRRGRPGPGGGRARARRAQGRAGAPAARPSCQRPRPGRPAPAGRSGSSTLETRSCAICRGPFFDGLFAKGVEFGAMDVGLVCDACSALTPIGVPQCARCGAAVALDPRPVARSRASHRRRTRRDSTPCPKCGTVVAAEAEVLPERAGSDSRRRQIRGSTSRRASVRTRQRAGRHRRTPPRAARASRPQHAVLRRRDAVRAREADADPRRRRGRRVVHARRPGAPRRSRRMPDLVPRRSVPVADARELLLPRRTSELVVRDEGSLNGVYVRISGTVAARRPARPCWSASRCSTVARAPQPDDVPTPRARTSPRACRGPRRSRSARTCAAARPAGCSGSMPDDRRRSAARATTSTSPRTRSSRAVTRSSGSPAACYRSPIWDRATARSFASTASGCCEHGDYVFLGQQLLRVEIV